MKIKCEYCGSMFDDTLEKCPNCGGTNNNVRRSTDDQPTTIEGLKEWYKSKGLPDEEVTRFFIGRNYMGPKAFGIYKEQNGKFIVYKNKADGSRAVRYEGTDEAFAVNELLTRLKQEILEQKSRAVKKKPDSVNRSAPAPQPKLSPEEERKSVLAFLAVVGILIATIVGLAFLIKGVRAASIPYMGYYSHNGELYYHCEESPYNWMQYDKAANDWKLVSDIVIADKELSKRKSSKQYYLGEGYDTSFGAFDVKDSVAYKDYETGYSVDKGYYDYDDTVYYHNGYLSDYNWYYYDTDDDDWISVPDDMVPDVLTHQSVAGDFWYTPEWDTETQITDFEDSAAYQEYVDRNSAEEDDDDWWGTSDDSSSDDYDWDWGSDSWDSGSTDWGSDW